MEPTVARKELLTAIIATARPISRVEIKEVTMEPKQKAPLHLHPCTTVGVILEGTISFQIEGQPVQSLHVGDAFYEPIDVRVAKLDNYSDVTARFAVFYLLGPNESDTLRILAE